MTFSGVIAFLKKIGVLQTGKNADDLDFIGDDDAGGPVEADAGGVDDGPDFGDDGGGDW